MAGLEPLAAPWDGSRLGGANQSRQCTRLKANILRYSYVTIPSSPRSASSYHPFISVSLCSSARLRLDCSILETLHIIAWP